MNSYFKNRLVAYFLGLFIMTIGISLSVKSNLGVSPVSSIPYTITLIWGIEMGKATILFHIVLVALQILILRRNFKIKSLLQIAIGIVFGYFTTFCNYLVEFMPDVDNIAIRIVMALISTVFIAVGIFFYMPADIMPLAGEGIMQTVSNVSHIEFSKIKVTFDVSMVLISLITCLCLIGSIGSVGIGTIIAALLTGVEVGFITKLFADRRDIFLGKKEVKEEAAA